MNLMGIDLLNIQLIIKPYRTYLNWSRSPNYMQMCWQYLQYWFCFWNWRAKVWRQRPKKYKTEFLKHISAQKVALRAPQFTKSLIKCCFFKSTLIIVFLTILYFAIWKSMCISQCVCLPRSLYHFISSYEEHQCRKWADDPRVPKALTSSRCLSICRTAAAKLVSHTGGIVHMHTLSHTHARTHKCGVDRLNPAIEFRKQR